MRVKTKAGDKKMKNPNGYGSVVNLGKHRRNPWAVRITAGWEGEKQIYRYISYHPTKKDALKALAQEQITPTPPKSNITFAELFEEWKAIAYQHISKQTQDNYNAAFKHLTPIHSTKFINIRTAHIQRIIDELDKSKSTKSKIKLLAGLLYKYAMQNDIVNKNYAEFVRLDKTEKNEKDIFTDIEIETLRKNDTIAFADTILILIYTGMRISELLTLSKFGVDLETGIITGGLKTDAGKNRTIPIHSKIYNYIQKYYATSKIENLIYRTDASGKQYPVTPNYYRKNIYYPLLEQLSIARHTPHSTRHTCATLLARSGADTNAIKQILGHTEYAFTADTYTHTDVNYLKKSIDMI